MKQINSVPLAPRTIQRVLVVDADDASRKTATWVLLGMGYEVVSVDSGADAFEKILKAPETFQFVLTGANHSDFTGIDLIKALKHIPATAEIPVILTALNPLMELSLAELEYRHTAFAPKPLHEDLLRREIDHLFSKGETGSHVVSV